jgi:hypothetical protein
VIDTADSGQSGDSDEAQQAKLLADAQLHFST